MIFSGLFLLGEIPFTDVIITSTVMAVDGRRMSKSLGTGIDPLEAVRKHGADATRYGLLKMSSQQDPRFAWDKLEEGQKLANKLWNVARLILANGEGQTPDMSPRDIEERWILGRIDETRAEMEEDLPAFNFAAVVDSLYHLTFDDFCDWYAEAIKPRLYEGDADAQATALANLEHLLKLLHPVLPHVTEEIWSQIHDDRLIVAPWPESREADEADLRALDRVQDAARIFRRSGTPIELNDEEQRIFDAVVKPERAKADGALRRVQEAAAVFRRSGVVPALHGDEKRIFDAVVKPERAKANGDAEAERERLRKEIARAEGMLANERFVHGAPDHVVAAERAKLERYRRELESIGG